MEQVDLHGYDGIADNVAEAILENPELGSQAMLSSDVRNPSNASVVLLPKGARLVLTTPHCPAEARCSFYAKAAADAIRTERSVWLRHRPIGSPHQMPLRKEDLKLLNDKRCACNFR